LKDDYKGSAVGKTRFAFFLADVTISKLYLRHWSPPGVHGRYYDFYIDWGNYKKTRPPDFRATGIKQAETFVPGYILGNEIPTNGPSSST